MNVPVGANLNATAVGSKPENVEIPAYFQRDPTLQDVNYPLGKEWINTLGNKVWVLTSFIGGAYTLQANWTLLNNAAETGIITLSGEGGTAYPSEDSNFNLSGSIAGGAPVDGAILFSANSPGEMSAAVQVDGATIGINGSNQLYGINTALTITGDTGGALSPSSGNWNIVGGTGVSTAGSGNTLTINASGSALGDQFTVDASTPPGTNPVVANGSGIVVITGNQVSPGTVSTGIRTNSTVANTIIIEGQQTSSSGAANANLNGLAHFDSNYFNVGATGYVSLANGSSTGFYYTTTFTPSLAIGGLTTGITYNSRSARITKVGNVIHYTIVINILSKGSNTGNVSIEGLPITSGTTSYPIRGFLSTYGVTSPLAGPWGFYTELAAGSTSLFLYVMTGTNGNITDNQIVGSGSLLYAQGHYFLN